MRGAIFGIEELLLFVNVACDAIELVLVGLVCSLQLQASPIDCFIIRELCGRQWAGLGWVIVKLRTLGPACLFQCQAASVLDCLIQRHATGSRVAGNMRW